MASFCMFAGQKSAYDINLDVVKSLPPLQEREKVRRYGGGGGRGGFSDRRDGGNRFSGGRGGFSDRRNDRFSRGQSGGRGFQRR